MSERVKIHQQAVVLNRRTVDVTGLDVPAGARVVRKYNPGYLDDDIWLEWDVELTPAETIRAAEWEARRARVVEAIAHYQDMLVELDKEGW